MITGERRLSWSKNSTWSEVWRGLWLQAEADSVYTDRYFVPHEKPEKCGSYLCLQTWDRLLIPFYWEPSPGPCSCKDRERQIRGGRFGSPGAPRDGIRVPGAGKGDTRALFEEEPSSKAQLWQSLAKPRHQTASQDNQQTCPKNMSTAEIILQQRRWSNLGGASGSRGSKGNVGSLTHGHGRAGCSREPARCWKWKAFSCCPQACSSLKYLHLQSFWVWQPYRHCVQGRASGFAVSVNIKGTSHPCTPLACFSAQSRCLHLNFCTEPSKMQWNPSARFTETSGFEGKITLSFGLEARRCHENKSIVPQMRGNTLQIFAELRREEKWICKSSNGVSVYNYYHASNIMLVEQDNFLCVLGFPSLHLSAYRSRSPGQVIFFFLMSHKGKEMLNIKPPDRKFSLSQYGSCGCLENAVQILFFTLFLQVVSNTHICSHSKGCAHDRALE